jgi:predicted nucleic acid-binding protein
MAKKSKKLVLIDSGVIFDYLKGNEKVKAEILEKIGIDNACVSTISILETYYGMLKNETKDTKSFFKQVNQLTIDKETCQEAIGLMLSYRRNKIALADCLIAAICLVNNAQLYTYNIQDFDYIKGLKIYMIMG